MADLPDRVEWGDQEVLSKVIEELMPGHWHDGHRTILSRNCSEQQVRARGLRKAPTVQAMSMEEVQKRGDVTLLTRTQVKVASQLDWGLELVMTVPHEVKRLANEVDLKKIKYIWDPWAGTGVISKVMLLEWPHLEVMNNDWNWNNGLVFRNPLTRARMSRGGEATGVGMFTFSMGRLALNGVTTDDAEQALI
ncbi:hypothetical protein CYMTET_38946 [Cymbomonas tetramitiformis]|uniref:Uncharacterized protein n=1 Tax=Cymbomonas tetramitiformis TaxID=36881 RepID=A0AAE0F4F1_9CHLO|nr:hypothetical protein CYMTET_38946 [Cymbomonas tetramitiformis]